MASFRFLPSSLAYFRRSGYGLGAVCGAALFAALLLRGFAGLNAPMWLDETFTGAISVQGSARAFLQQVLDEGNAPLYYLCMFLWAHVAGTSDLAYRIPSVLFAVLAAAIAGAAFPRRRTVSLAWAAVLALWIPGIILSGDARDYTLVYAAATAQTVAFVRLLEHTTLRRAAVFVGSASLMVLCHYYACFLALTEALVLCVWLRGRLFRLWPAGLVALPAMAWLAVHGPRVVRFAGAGVVWYDRVPLGQVPFDLSLLWGGPVMVLLGMMVVLIALLGARGCQSAPDAGGRGKRGALAAAFTAAFLAAALLVTVGCLRPFFVSRYLVPEAPGALLGLVALIQRAGRGREGPLAALVGSYLAVAVGWAAHGGVPENVYSFERASAWVAATRPDHLVFYWDHPNTPAETRRQLEAVGGFFFTRSGHPVPVVPLYPQAQDMSRLASSAAGRAGAVIWLYDTAVRGTRAAVAPPVLSVLTAGRECRNFGRDNIGVLACRPVA